MLTNSCILMVISVRVQNLARRMGCLIVYANFSASTKMKPSDKCGLCSVRICLLFDQPPLQMQTWYWYGTWRSCLPPEQRPHGDPPAIAQQSLCPQTYPLHHCIAPSSCITIAPVSQSALLTTLSLSQRLHPAMMSEPSHRVLVLLTCRIRHGRFVMNPGCCCIQISDWVTDWRWHDEQGPQQVSL